jgi:hypothetical protein
LERTLATGGPDVVYEYVHVLALPGTRSIGSVKARIARIIFWSACGTSVFHRLVSLPCGRFHCVASEEVSHDSDSCGRASSDLSMS